MIKKKVNESIQSLPEHPPHALNNYNKYGNDNETRIIFATLKPQGTVTTAPNIKE